jgi:hypothetical protein
MILSLHPSHMHAQARFVPLNRALLNNQSAPVPAMSRPMPPSAALGLPPGPPAPPNLSHCVSMQLHLIVCVCLLCMRTSVPASAPSGGSSACSPTSVSGRPFRMVLVGRGGMEGGVCSGGWRWRKLRCRCGWMMLSLVVQAATRVAPSPERGRRAELSQTGGQASFHERVRWEHAAVACSEVQDGIIRGRSLWLALPRPHRQLLFFRRRHRP